MIGSDLYREITHCRNCNSGRLEKVLDLGTPAISDFVHPGGQEDHAPLVLLQCSDCSLVQLQHTVDRSRLYSSYYYRSGTNESMVKALREVVDEAITRIPFPANKDTVVMDIGSNDCTLLNMYPDSWWKIGFEPSNIPQQPDIPPRGYVYKEFFPSDAAKISPCHIITSLAMFYDLDDPNAFVAGIKDWLAPDGIWIVQMPSLQQMLHLNAFDNICHEHLTYWPIHALLQLADRHGLEIAAISTNDVNGSSTRYTFRHAKVPRKPSKAKWLWNHHLTIFRENIESLRDSTLRLLENLDRQGKMTIGYGASTKGNTLLQYYGIGPTLLTGIADRNPDKHGKWTAGSHIHIFSEEWMRDINPDHLFVLPWGFLPAFQQREATWLQRGGQFIIPLPKLRIVGSVPCPSIPAAR